MAVDDIPTDLPRPTGSRLPLPESRRAGWWADPAKSHPLAVRYFDGTRWTEFVCCAARTIVTAIERLPLPPEFADDEAVGFTNEPKGAEPANVTSLIRYVAVAFVGLSFLTISSAVPRSSAASEWTNRIGVLLLLILTAAFAIKDLRGLLTGRGPGERWVDRWVPILVSIIVPAVLPLKLWNRVLDALWLN